MAVVDDLIAAEDSLLSHIPVAESEAPISREKSEAPINPPQRSRAEMIAAAAAEPNQSISALMMAAVPPAPTPPAQEPPPAPPAQEPSTTLPAAPPAQKPITDSATPGEQSDCDKENNKRSANCIHRNGVSQCGLCTND